MMSPVISKPQGDSKDEDNSIEFVASSHVIAANDDLLSQILVRLPVKSLLRFKSVSKDWLSLIASPQFRRLQSQRRCSRETSGLLLRRISSRYRPNPEYDFISVYENRKQADSPLERLNFVDDERGLDALQFCNGLLLCRSSCFGIASSRVENRVEIKYYVFNPTTKEYTIVLTYRVESGKIRQLCAVNLAFDPSKSLHFKVICIYCYNLLDNSDSKFELGIYSSETGITRQIEYPSLARADFFNALYWNGAINWIDYKRDGLYFNVDEELFGTLPMLPVPTGMEDNGRWIRYFGESNGHLHLLVETQLVFTPQFNVYELDNEYSWFVRFRVDLQPVMSSFPEFINHKLNPLNFEYYSFGILAIARMDDDEESFLVLSVPGKAIRYHFKDKSCTKMCDFDPVHDRDCSLPLHTWEDSIGFIESLHPL